MGMVDKRVNERITLPKVHLIGTVLLLLLITLIRGVILSLATVSLLIFIRVHEVKEDILNGEEEETLLHPLVHHLMTQWSPSLHRLCLLSITSIAHKGTFHAWKRARKLEKLKEGENN